MNVLDIAILVIVGISAVFSIFRGLVKEVLSIIAWVVSFWAAFTFTDAVGGGLERWISSPAIRWLVGFFIIFIGVLAVTAFINMLISKLVVKSGLSGTDRMLGLVFGVVRGAIIVSIMVFICQMTPFPREPMWQQSSLIPHFEVIARQLVRWLPDDIRGQLGGYIEPGPAREESEI